MTPQILAKTDQPEVITIEALQLSMPQLAAQTAAAKAAIEHHKAYANTIDCDEVYTQFVGPALTEVKATLNAVIKEEKADLAPLQKIRTTALEEMDRIKGKYAPLKHYLQISEGLLKQEVTRWQLIEDRRKEREKHEALRKQEEESQRIAAEAEAQAQEQAAEALRLQQEAAQALEAGDASTAINLHAQVNQALSRAAETRADGQSQADIIRSQPVASSRPATKLKGQSLTEKWDDVGVSDIMEVCRGIVEGKIPVTAIVSSDEVQIINVNMRWVRSEGSRLKEHFNYPGLYAKKRTGMSVRA